MNDEPPFHPGDDTLRALSLGQLADGELAQVSAHLDACAACCLRIDELAIDDRLVARLQQSASSRDQAIVNQSQRRPAVQALRMSNAAKSATPHPPHTNRSARVHPVPTEIGDYHILAEVGRGGMGVVYKARHRRLNRLAALKMVLAGEFASPKQELRFRLEAELAARVQHPNIVQVHEIGTYEGRPFLALEWVEGGSLADRLDGHAWPPADAAALIETLAHAIDAAHTQGVVHRDLKPGNILLQKIDRREETGENRTACVSHVSTVPGISTNYRLLTAGYCAKITDFGLAQTLEGRQTMTQSGFLVGTPEYMAPEQAGGKRALVGPGTDIYALGVMLYQLLTGRLPFQADGTLDLLRSVTADEPIRPGRHQPGLPRDLEAITLRCLEKEPGKRYASALDLAEDLRRFRAGEIIAARPQSGLERVGKFVRRYKAVVGGAVATGLALLVGTVFSLLFAFGEARQRFEADRAHGSALREAYSARLAAAVMSMREGNVREAASQLEAAPVDLRGWEWQHLQARVTDLSPRVLSPHPDFDGWEAYLSPGKYLIARKNKGYVLVDQQSLEKIRDLCDDSAFRAIVRSPPRMFVAYQRSEGSTTLVDDTGAETAISAVWEKGLHASMSRDRKLLALHSPYPNDHWLRLLELPSGRLRLKLNWPERLHAVAFSPDGTRLAVATKEPVLYLLDTTTGTKSLLRGHTSEVFSVAFHPDGKRLISAGFDKIVRQWDVGTGESIGMPRVFTTQVNGVTYSPDGLWIAASGEDGTVQIWKSDDSEPPTELPDHGSRVYESFFNPDGLTISTKGDAEIPWHTWPTPAAANLVVLRGHSSFVYPVVHSPDGRLIASAGWDDDCGIRLWDSARGTLVAVLKGHTDAIFSLAFSLDSRRLISRSDDATLRIWNADTGAALAVKPCGNVVYRGHTQSVVVSADNQSILTGAKDGLRCWDLDTGAEQSPVGLPLRDVRVLAVRSQDGLLAVCGEGRDIVLFDRNAGQVRKVLTSPGDAPGFVIQSLAFSPDGRQLLSAGNARVIEVWDVESGDPPRELRGHSGEIFTAVFHPDGRRIFSAGRDRVIRVWDPVQGDELVRLLGHSSYIFSLSFSPDGATLASGSGDFTIRLWETERFGRRLEARRQEQEACSEAEQLLERLFREESNPDRVADRLNIETGRSESLKRAARNALYRRQGLTPP